MKRYLVLAAALTVAAGIGVFPAERSP